MDGHFVHQAGMCHLHSRPLHYPSLTYSRKPFFLLLLLTSLLLYYLFFLLFYTYYPLSVFSLTLHLKHTHTHTHIFFNLAFSCILLVYLFNFSNAAVLCIQKCRQYTKKCRQYKCVFYIVHSYCIYTPTLHQSYGEETDTRAKHAFILCVGESTVKKHRSNARKSYRVKDISVAKL